MKSLMLAVALLLSLQAFAGDKEDILSVVNGVLKRKDIDQVKATLKDPTYAVGDTLMSLVKIVESRDRDRAMGTGAYEETLQEQVYASGSLGYAVVRTAWYSKQDDRKVVENRINTVVLYKDAAGWKVVHWHVSAGQRRWND